MIGISCTMSFTYSRPNSRLLGSSKPTVRICSMILSSAGEDQRCQLRGVCGLPDGDTNCECQLSRKNDKSGWPPQVSTLHEMIVSKSAEARRSFIVPCATSVLASMPNCRHCCAIIEPARVITGRASPSTTILTVKILPSGVYQSLPRLVKPAACSNSVAACGLGFHHPIPKDLAIC